MNILIIHNFHRSGAPSGDDVVVRQEMELLKSKGNNVFLLSRHNDDFEKYSMVRKLSTFLNLHYSRASYSEVFNFLKKERVDIVHIHNVFPLWTPAVYFAGKDAGIPVVHTLHDFRFFCANAFLFREGQICELCLEKSGIYSLYFRCFKNSVPGSFLVARYLSKVKGQKLYNLADAYIALGSYSKEKLAKFGIPAEKIVIKPNFVEDLVGEPDFKKQNYFVYVGRLSREKGLDVLLSAFSRKELSNMIVKVIGSGPEEDEYKNYVMKNNLGNVDFLGFLPRKEVLNVVQGALALIFPSNWPETFGMVIAEAFQAGTTVIASNFGTMADIVEDGKTGLLFKKGDPQDLAKKILYLANNPEIAIEMGKNARQEYLQKYTPEVNYNILMDIYRRVIEEKRG
ncbi:MAG: glycosyltransferase family 4 protein [candidate division WOR-3 bacterium]